MFICRKAYKRSDWVSMLSALLGIHLGGGRIFCRVYTIKLLFTLKKVKKNFVLSAKMVFSIVKTHNFILFKL